MKMDGWKVIEEIRSVQPQEDQYIPQLTHHTVEPEGQDLPHQGIHQHQIKQYRNYSINTFYNNQYL